MSSLDQQDLPPIKKRFSQAYADYNAARTSAIECVGNRQLDEAQVWATLAAAAATVLAEPVPHCSKCCY